jgi:NAD(P)-dependent dehydrogenase (short-subunit alcohol dehydrogenase family)
VAFETTTAEVVDGLDLSGRTVVITGVSAGLGVESARVLRGAGARVIGAARDLDKARAVVGDLELVELDLADTGSARKAAADVLALTGRIDVLLNNAGVMACPLGRTAQGFETQIGTNHLGHFVWTNALVPALGEGSRIVNLSSRGHLLSGMRWDDPNWESTPYEKWTAYGQSKTANVLFTVGLEKRLAAQGTHAFAVHPGVIQTELGRHLSEEDVALLGARRNMARKTVEQGAATQVWAATSPTLEGLGGLYLEDCEISTPVVADGSYGFAAHAVDPAEAERLWEWSEAQTA